MDVPINKIVCGEAKAVMSGWPAESVNCCISSPPYWALRDYGVAGQLGLETTFEEYIDKLCGIYDEVKRVLRKDGTCWVNLGDTYSGSGGEHKPWHKSDSGFQHKGGFSKHALDNEFTRQRGDLQAKSLCLIPQRFAIEMVNRGWILRNVLIWHKPNPMPSSAKDRFTVDFEYVYFFVKSKRYWFEPQYEAYLTESNAERPRMGQGNQTKYNQKRGYKKFNQRVRDVKRGKIASAQYKASEVEVKSYSEEEVVSNPLGRNKRTVWTIPTQPFPEAHFATFPEKLVEPMILSGCPEFVCTKCGKGREKVYDREVVHNRPNTRPDANVRPDNYERIPSDWKPKETKCLGYSDCGCGAEFAPGIVLDPFVVRARPVWLLPKTEGIGLGLSLNRNISKWRNAA